MKQSILKAILLITIGLSTAFTGWSQTISDIKAMMLEDGRVKISYMLTGQFPDQKFDIKIYASVNDFTAPLIYVTGDVNTKSIKPGLRSVIWDAAKEIKSFDGKLSFKIEATPVALYKVVYPIAGEKFKRGHTVPIKWEGFSISESLKIELYKGQRKVHTITDFASGYSYEWKVPKSVKPGRKYNIRVASSFKETNFAQSGTIKIKRKVPIVVTIGIVGGLAGAAAWYFLQPEVLEPLPSPPGPPSQ